MIELPAPLRQRLIELALLLREHAPSSRLCLVGGSVREALRGHPANDCDLEVSGMESQQLGAILAQHWPAHAQPVGKVFAVFKLPFPEGVFDISAHPDDALQAARRRDFTVNALAWDPLSAEMLDPFGGLADLSDGLLRCVDRETFVQDPLRVYRAAQFRARLNFRVESSTQELCARLVRQGALDELPAERISEEWKKLLLKPAQPSLGLEWLRQVGRIERRYRELHQLIGIEQDVRWHPEGDVWVHTMLVVDQAARLKAQRSLTSEQQQIVMFGALLHDLGKVTTTVHQSDGSITAHGHEAAGPKPARRFLARIRLGEAIDNGILNCVEEHMRPAQLARMIEEGRLSPRQGLNALRRLLRDVRWAGWEAFIAVCEADKRGRGPEETRSAPYLPSQILEPLLRNQPEPTLLSLDPLLRGRDLVERGMLPGPALGDLIREAEELRDQGELATRAEALEWLNQRLARRRPGRQAR